MEPNRFKDAAQPNVHREDPSRLTAPGEAKPNVLGEEVGQQLDPPTDRFDLPPIGRGDSVAGLWSPGSQGDAYPAGPSEVAEAVAPTGGRSESGWVVPKASRRFALGRVLVGLVVVVGLGFAVVGLQSALGGSGTGGVETIGFSAGGSGCDLANVTRFAVGVPVRLAAQFDPALPVGDTVTIAVSENGTERTDLGATLKWDTASNCISGILPYLRAGHYRVAVSSGTDTGMPPISGEFDVGP